MSKPVVENAEIVELTRRERVAMADTLAALTPEQWSRPSLCGGWSVQVAAGHIVAGAEQTRPHFARRLAASGFRFNTMIDRDARHLGSLPPSDIIRRLRASATSAKRAPAPPIAMLGEVVVHGADIRHPLGLASETSPAVVATCLESYSAANFPVGTKKRIDGLRLVDAEGGWSHGDGPEVSGPGLSLLLAITGRAGALDDLTGDGVVTLRRRITMG